MNTADNYKYKSGLRYYAVEILTAGVTALYIQQLSASCVITHLHLIIWRYSFQLRAQKPHCTKGVMRSRACIVTKQTATMGGLHVC